MAQEWPIVGHGWAVQQLRTALVHDDVPHALLITGPDNVGKTTLARLLVAALLCREVEIDLRPCGTCISCRKLSSGNHLDFMEVSPEEKGGTLKIEQIRAIERFLALTPNESRYKVAMACKFERATPSAANALLKTLEEPPAYAHLILLASDPDLLLPTIVSRSQQINLRPVPPNVLVQALVEQCKVAPPTAERLARISGGRVGWAMQAARAEVEMGWQEALELLFDVLQQDLPSRFATAHALSIDQVKLAERLEHWLAAWRDVLLLQTRGSTAVTYDTYLDKLHLLAERLSLHSILDCLHALETTQQLLLTNANPQLLVENLLLDLPGL